jgi:hypothetical protein
MVAADMPWYNLNDKYFQAFLKYCKCNTSQESTIQKIYLDDCYYSTLRKIRENSFYVDELGTTFLIACKFLEEIIQQLLVLGMILCVCYGQKEGTKISFGYSFQMLVMHS